MKNVMTIKQEYIQAIPCKNVTLTKLVQKEKKVLYYRRN
jgi:hypothetical protein